MICARGVDIAPPGTTLLLRNFEKKLPGASVIIRVGTRIKLGVSIATVTFIGDVGEASLMPGAGDEDEDDDDDDDGSDSGESSVSAISRASSSSRGRALKIPFPNGAEIDVLACDMKRDNILEKLPELREDLEVRHEVILEILEMNEKDFEVALATRDDARQADAYIRRYARAVVKGKTNEMKVWKAQEKALRRDPAKKARARCGRYLLERMEAFGELDQDDVREHLEMMNKKEYLRVGMSRMEAMAAMETFRTDWSILPRNRRDALELTRELVRKVPEEIGGDTHRTFAEMLIDDMDTAESMKQPPIVFEKLTVLIAKRVAKTKKNLHAITKKGDQPCFGCGKTSAQGCPGWSGCKERCSISGVKGCTCCSGHPCLFRDLSKASLPPNDKCIGGTGAPIHRDVYKKCQKRLKELKEGKTKTANTANKDEDDEADEKDEDSTVEEVPGPTRGRGRGRGLVFMLTKQQEGSAPDDSRDDTPDHLGPVPPDRRLMHDWMSPPSVGSMSLYAQTPQTPRPSLSGGQLRAFGVAEGDISTEEERSRDVTPIVVERALAASGKSRPADVPHERWVELLRTEVNTVVTEYEAAGETVHISREAMEMEMAAAPSVPEIAATEAATATATHPTTPPFWANLDEEEVGEASALALQRAARGTTQEQVARDYDEWMEEARLAEAGGPVRGRLHRMVIPSAEVSVPAPGGGSTQIITTITVDHPDAEGIPCIIFKSLGGIMIRQQCDESYICSILDEQERRVQGLVYMMSKHVLIVQTPPAVHGRNQAVVRFLIDTGADCVLNLTTEELGPYAMAETHGVPGVDGVGGTSGAVRELDFRAAMLGAETTVFDVQSTEVKPSRTLRANVISHSLLRRLTGATIRYEPELKVIFGNGEWSEIHPKGAHYFVDIVIFHAGMNALPEPNAGGPDNVPNQEAEPGMALISKARAEDPDFLMALRYGVDARELLRLSKAVDGMNITKLSQDTIVMINNDEALRRSRHQRRGTTGSVPAKQRLEIPSGHTFVVDVWPSSIPCSVTRCTAVVHAFDKKDTFGYGSAITVQNEEVVTEFCESIIIAEARIPGHEVKVFKIDAIGYFKDEGAKQRFEKRTRCKLERAGGDDHEFMTIGEACMKPLTKRTEAAMFRAKAAVPPVPDGMAIKCRLYQLQIWNQNINGTESGTRTQIHGRIAPSCRSTPMPLFYTRCSVTAIGQQKGPKGLMGPDHSSRERTGRIIGYERYADGTGRFELTSDGTGEKITRNPKDLDPLDEHVLARAGLAAGTATTDCETQCDVESLPKLQLQTKPAPVAKVKEVVKHVLPKDVKPEEGWILDVLWKDHKGDCYRFHRCKVIRVEHKEDGTQREQVSYDAWTGKDKVFTHDLAKDLLTGAHAWKRVAVAEGSKTGPGQKAPARTSARLSAQKAALLVEIDAMDDLVATSKHPESMHDACCDALLGAKRGEVFHVEEHGGSLASAARALYGEVMGGRVTVKGNASDPPELREPDSDDEDLPELVDREPDSDEEDVLTVEQLRAQVAQQQGLKPSAKARARGQVLKAQKSKTTVKFRAVKGGELTEYLTPSSDRDIFAAVDSTQWLEEEHKAIHEAILALPGREIVDAETIYAEGHEVMDLTTTRYYKIDPETQLLKRRKVRHSLDEKRARQAATKRGPEELDKIEQYCKHTMPVGEIESNLLLAACANPNKYMALLDWKDAYGLGKGNRPPRYVRPPKTVPLHTAEGKPGLIKLGHGTGLWGEGPAGFEWEETRDEDMAYAGWPRCAEVPAIFQGGPGSRGGVIIDDLLAFCDDSYEPLEKLCAALSKRSTERGGAPIVLIKAPTTWGGCKSNDRTTGSR